MPRLQHYGEIDGRLVWLMGLRVVVVTLLLGLAVTTDVIRTRDAPVNPLYTLIAVTYLLTLLYALAWPFTADRRRVVAYAQILGDLMIITGIVYFTGGVESSFSLLYYISIIAASIILYRRGGLVAASAALALYGGLVGAVHAGLLPPYPSLSGALPLPLSPRALSYTVFLTAFGFFTVAVLTSYVSENLREAGRELEETTDYLADLQVFNQTIVDSITAGLMTTDMEGRVNFMNDSAEQILAVRGADALGRNVVELLDEAPDFLDRVKAELEGRRYCRLEGTYRNGRGENVYLGMSISYLLFKRERRSGFLFVFQDLTEIKRLEREVHLKESLATLGEMAAGMAHEIRNPLASISGSVQVLKDELGLRGESSRLMEIIVRESERLSSILHEFLAYSRPPRFEPEEIDLRTVLEETAALLRHSAELKPGHEIALRLPDRPVRLFADPNQMKQITWNLARNALQAMPDGGLLEMELGRNGKGEVVMRFRDEGVGLPGEVHELFQPFTGRFGSGLGLAIVYRIVKDYDGTIRFDSRQPRGTEVSVHFPGERRSLG